MSNNNQIPWKIIIPAIVVILAAIIGATWAVWLNPPPSDFCISVNPMKGEVHKGGVITTAITIKGIQGYEHPVSLSASGLPSGIVVTFIPPIGGPTPSYTSSVTINVDPIVPAGDYEIVKKGTGADGKEHSCNYILTVKRRAVTPTPTQIPTPTPTIAPITQLPEIKFTYPEKEGYKFPLATGHTVEGTASNVPDDLSLWIVTVAPNNMWYPNTPVVIFKDTWSAKIWIGTPENIGEKFYIHAILADEKADKELGDYMDECRRKGSWPGLHSLPKGAKVYAKVMVIGR